MAAPEITSLTVSNKSVSGFTINMKVTAHSNTTAVQAVGAPSSVSESMVKATIAVKTTKPADEQDGEEVYTATAVFEGKTYTDIRIRAITAVEVKIGKWEWYGEDTDNDGIEDNYYKVEVTLVEKNNSLNIISTKELTPTSSGNKSTWEASGEIIYTAYITINGTEECYDTKVVEFKASGDTYNVVAWFWDECRSATVKLVKANDSTDVQSVEAEITYELTDKGLKKYTATAIFKDQIFTAVKTVTQYGDLNFDTVIDSNDALFLLRASVGLESLTDNQKIVGDVNGDGVIDSSDALGVLRYSVGYSVDMDSGDRTGNQVGV